MIGDSIPRKRCTRIPIKQSPSNRQKITNNRERLIAIHLPFLPHGKGRGRPGNPFRSTRVEALMPDVFIAFSRPDMEAAKKVRQALEGAGVQCALAHRDVEPDGKDLDVRPVDRSRAVLLIFTANTDQSIVSILDHAVACATPTIWLALDQTVPSGELARLRRFAIPIHASGAPLESHLSHITDCVRPFCAKSGPVQWCIALRRAKPRSRLRPATARGAAMLFVGLLVVAFVGGAFFNKQVIGLANAVFEYFQRLILV